MKIRACLIAIALAVVTLPTAALVASADEDPPIRPEIGGPPIRPPLSELRETLLFPVPSVPEAVHTGQVPDAIPSFPASRAAHRELVVVVGGYQSEFKDPKPLKDFVDGLDLGPTYDVIRFGDDPRFRYDTLGSLDENARRLSDEVLSKARDYDGVHLIGHSMGGSVVDRAFVKGYLPDGGPILTYTALSSPHAGSTAARDAELTLALSGPARADVNDVARLIDIDADTRAMRDLATRLERPRLRRVTRLDIRMATDLTVSAADADDPGVDSRTLLPHTLQSLEGHGGTLTDPMSRQLTRETIVTRAAPRDERGIFERNAIGPVTAATDLASTRGFPVLCGLIGVLGVALWLSRRLLGPKEPARILRCVGG